MVDKNKTHIVIVMDRSWSMRKIASKMEEGLNTFIEDQKKQV